MNCDECGWPLFAVRRAYTADTPRSWQHDDGEWWCGLPRRVHRYTCGGCGKVNTVEYRTGKRDE
ncbi:MAG: hypothetical protein AAF581_11090 [Planctomycetota bacterium]